MLPRRFRCLAFEALCLKDVCLFVDIDCVIPCLRKETRFGLLNILKTTNRTRERERERGRDRERQRARVCFSVSICINLNVVDVNTNVLLLVHNVTKTQPTK